MTCYSMDEHEDIMLSEMSHLKKDKCIIITLPYGSSSSQIHREKSRILVSRGLLQGGVNGELLFNEYRISYIR